MSVLLDVRQGPSPYTVQNPVEYTSTELKEEPTCVVHALCAISHTLCFTNTVSLSPTMTCNREHREAVHCMPGSPPVLRAIALPSVSGI